MSHTTTIRAVSEPGFDKSWVRTWTSRFTLPPDLMGQARRRLGLLALVIGGLSLLSGPVGLCSFIETGADQVIGVALACTVVVSFALFHATRSKRFGDGVVVFKFLPHPRRP